MKKVLCYPELSILAHQIRLNHATIFTGYIRADQIEQLVWEEVKKVIENPNLILAELEKRDAASKAGTAT